MTVESVPTAGSRRGAAAWLVVLAAAYAALAATAAVRTPLAFVVVAAVVAGTELALPHRAPALEWALTRVEAGTVLRGLLRGLLLLLLAARGATGNPLLLVAGAVVATTLLRAARVGLAVLVTYLRQPPLLTRNVSLAAVSIAPAPPGWLRRPRGLDVAADLPAALGVAAVAAGSPSGSPAPAVLGLSITVLALAVSPAVLARHVVRLLRGGVRGAVVKEVQRQLADLRAEVVLYFAGSQSSAYQVEMWLEPVEQLGRPALVLVRDREVLASLPPTSLPVLCVTAGSTLMALELGDPRLALYVSNASGNIHLLRRRGLWSVFVGHGDSDKAASSSPFSRVYDEIWVAGPAGRDRYLAAGIGVTADRVVEVGRPQLAAAPRAAPPAAGPGDPRPPLTVLYAPTWEGWGDEPHHASVANVGPALVAALLARPGVRVLYRPHPLTGSRDPAVRAANRCIIAALRRARAVGPEVASEPAPGVAGGLGSGDLLDMARDTGAAPRWSRNEHRARLDAWNRHYWSAAPPDRHRILTSPAPDLYSCYDVTDGLIADVSSVVSDFLQTDHPYAVVNAPGLPPKEFRLRYPSSAGGMLLGPDLDGLDILLAAAGGGVDPTAPDRRAVRLRLIGAAETDPAAPFRSAVDRLCAAAPRHDARTAMGAW